MIYLFDTVIYFLTSQMIAIAFSSVRIEREIGYDPTLPKTLTINLSIFVLSDHIVWCHNICDALFIVGLILI